MSRTVVGRVNRTPLSFIILLAYLTLGVVTGLQTPDPAKLDAFGAARGVAIQNGEVWRLLAYAFLHGGFLHLLLNSYFLFIIGPATEQTLGTPPFALFSVVSAVSAGIAARLWLNPLAPLVGGSGALFGMMGAGVALYMRRGRHLLDFLNYMGPRQLVLLIGVNLVLGMMIPQVSNAGHIGGLIGGFALTFCFLERGREPVDRLGRAIQAGWLALFASLLFYSVRPVVRWDYMATQSDAASSAEKRAAFAQGVIMRTDNLRALRDILPPEIMAELRRRAEGR